MLEYYVRDRVGEKNHVGNVEPHIFGHPSPGDGYEEYQQEDVRWGDPPSRIDVFSNAGADNSDYRETQCSSVPIKVDFDVNFWIEDHFYRYYRDGYDGENDREIGHFELEKEDPKEEYHAAPYAYLEFSYDLVDKSTVMDQAWEEEEFGYGEDSDKEGMVSFRYTGEGGTFTKNVVFKLEGPEIVFGQENLGLPSGYKKPAELWFGVKGLPEPTVTARFREKDCPYTVELRADKEVPGLWCALIRDTCPEEKPSVTDGPEGEGERKKKPEPGDTTGFTLEITAVKDKETVTDTFQVIRVEMGLSFRLEGDALGCYQVIRKGAPAEPGPEDREPCKTRGRIALLRWNEEEKLIEKLAVVPELRCRVKALKVDNDKKSMIGAAEEHHQEMVRKLGIMVIPTRDVDTDGSRIVELCCTEAALDAPTRIRAEITVTVNCGREKYEVKKELLLHSLPIRKAETPEAYSRMLKQDDRICEQLTRIKGQIWSKYMHNLFSLYYFIDRMIEGYDPSFGYDGEQLESVMNVWVRFLRGETGGANAKGGSVTLADELNACYAFMQGMRDNGGFLGRMALGICTAGYSELVFFGMDLAEKMETTIVRQGKDMDFWDGVKMGAQEYAKQAATELVMGAALKTANFVGSEVVSAAMKKSPAQRIDLAKTAMTKYRTAMDAADTALKNRSGVYKGIATPLEEIGVFTKNMGTAAREAMDRSARADAQAKTRVQTTFAQRRMGDLGLSAEQMKALEIHDIANQRGMDKVRKLYEVMHRHGTARAEALEQALELRCKAHGCYVEGTRQIVKSSNNIVKARAKVIDAMTGRDPMTAQAREMTCAGELVNDGLDPQQFFGYLESEYGTDFNGFAETIADCLE